MIWVILLVALIVRLISLNQSFWLDEAIVVLNAQTQSFVQFVTQYALSDFHPPLYFGILWFWERVAGASEIAVRLPSVLFGVATVYGVYLIGRKTTSVNLGLVAALLLALNPLHIYYSQEARMYSLATWAVVWNFFFFLKILEGKKSFWGYLITLIFLLGADYIAYAVLLVQLFLLLLRKNRESFKNWFYPLLTGFLVWSWWTPFLISQLANGQNTARLIPGWGEVVGSANIKSLALTYVKFIIGRISYPDGNIYAILFAPLGLLYAWLIFQATRFEVRQRRFFLISWILIPILATWLVSWLVPVYSYFRLLFVLPAFILLFVGGLLSYRGLTRYLLLSAVVIIEIVCSAIYLFNPEFQREDWRSAMDFLKKQSDVLVILENPDSFSPFSYYGGVNKPWLAGLKKIPAENDRDITDLQKVSNYKKIYLMQYLVEITDPQRLLARRLEQMGFHQDYIFNFNGVGFIYQYTK